MGCEFKQRCKHDVNYAKVPLRRARFGTRGI